MKRFFLVFIFIGIILPNVFGQDKKHTVYVDIFPMGNGIFSGGAGLGLGYDYNINQYFSIGGLTNYFGNFNGNNTYSFIILGKYYPIKTKIGNPYLDAGFGCRRRMSEEDNIHCLVTNAHIGFKFILKNGLVLDPSFGFRYNAIPLSGSENYMFSFNIKAVIGWMF
jgi:hypothetical protein